MRYSIRLFLQILIMVIGLTYGWFGNTLRVTISVIIICAGLTWLIIDLPETPDKKPEVAQEEKA
jgi:hypothetical protein